MSKHKPVTIVIHAEQARSFLAWVVTKFPRWAERAQDMLDSVYPLIIHVYRRQPKRNLDQNALYWAWLECIGDHTGDTKDELHLALRRKILGYEVGAFGDIPISTTSLSTSEFADYLEQIQALAAEHGIRLPTSPEEWKAYKLAA